MEDKQRLFTSTGEKLLRHPEVLKKIRTEHRASPIVMHIMPTSQCNLRCSYCSVKDRETTDILDLEKTIIPTVDELKSRGLKAAIISGGGEPLMYKQFPQMVEYLFLRDLEVGLITNGTLLERCDPELLDQLKWMRISLNECAFDKISLPKQVVHPTLGFSYIVTPQDDLSLGRVKELVKEFQPEYVRLLPDCAQPLENLLAEHVRVGKVAQELGAPFFHQFKVPKTPEKCYLGYVHPVLYCDGNIYPCDSLVLNDHSNQQFKKDFILCDAKDIGKLYDEPMHSLVDTKKMCPGCVFERQNQTLINVADPISHENFI